MPERVHTIRLLQPLGLRPRRPISLLLSLPLLLLLLGRTQLGKAPVRDLAQLDDTEHLWRLIQHQLVILTDPDPADVVMVQHIGNLDPVILTPSELASETGSRVVSCELEGEHTFARHAQAFPTP